MLLDVFLAETEVVIGDESKIEGRITFDSLDSKTETDFPAVANEVAVGEPRVASDVIGKVYVSADTELAGSLYKNWRKLIVETGSSSSNNAGNGKNRASNIRRSFSDRGSFVDIILTIDETLQIKEHQS